MILKRLVAKRKEYLEQVITDKEFALRAAPEGGMEIWRRKDRVYYNYKPASQGGSKEEKRSYLKLTDQKDRALVCAIAQRDYDREVLKLARGEEKIIARLAKLYGNGPCEDVYSKLHPARRELVEPIRLTDEQYADNWQAQELPGSTPSREEAPFLTERGERVRSKSELLIANTLHKHGIRYHYECAVETIDHLTGMPRTRFPDFYLLNARTRRAYYYEHFGKCDDPDYVNDNLNKLIDYENVGIIAGVNLIMTFETRQTPLTPAIVEAFVKNYLL